MPAFKDLAVTLTLQINHEEDFTFRKHKEELALVVRSEHLPKIRELWRVEGGMVSFDREGDIQVETEKGSLYLTRYSVMGVSSRASIETIMSEDSVTMMPTVLNELFRARKPITALQYVVRAFLSVRFGEAQRIDELEPQFRALLADRLGGRLAQTEPALFKWSLTFREREFLDSLELSTNPFQVQLRYSRESPSGRFASFEEFVKAANIGYVLESFQPLIEHLIADPSRIRSDSFRENLPTN
jgi:hypothetical protein